MTPWTRECNFLFSLNQSSVSPNYTGSMWAVCTLQRAWKQWDESLRPQTKTGLNWSRSALLGLTLSCQINSLRGLRRGFIMRPCVCVCVCVCVCFSILHTGCSTSISKVELLGTLERQRRSCCSAVVVLVTNLLTAIYTREVSKIVCKKENWSNLRDIKNSESHF